MRQVSKCASMPTCRYQVACVSMCLIIIHMLLLVLSFHEARELQVPTDKYHSSGKS